MTVTQAEAHDCPKTLHDPLTPPVVEGPTAFTQQIRVEAIVQLPSVELTDAAAMALGRLAAVGMNSDVPVDKILAWARVVIEAQTKTAVRTWVKP
jgi:hypothetical protein